MRVASFVFLATACPLVLLAPRADAEGSAADEAIARGIALRREHKDAEALVEFRQAYALSQTPRALAQVALAEAALERWVPAESDLLRALAAEDDWIDRQRPALQIALKELQEHLSSLEVVCAQPAELWIDGVLATQLPAHPLRVVAKHLVLELHLVGFKLARREVDAPAGGVVHEEVALEPFEPLAAAPATAAAPPPLVPATTTPAVRDAGMQRTLAWVSAGAAGVFLAGGIAATVWGADRVNAFNNDGKCWDGVEPQPPAYCSSYSSQVKSAQIAVDIAYPAAGVAAITSAVLFLTLPRPSASATHARAWCLPTAGGVACGGTY
jgi:hypothetical protein